jgi:hypothetical protein
MKKLALKSAPFSPVSATLAMTLSASAPPMMMLVI